MQGGKAYHSVEEVVEEIIILDALIPFNVVNWNKNWLICPSFEIKITNLDYEILVILMDNLHESSNRHSSRFIVEFGRVVRIFFVKNEQK